MSTRRCFNTFAILHRNRAFTTKYRLTCAKIVAAERLKRLLSLGDQHDDLTS